MLTNNFTEFPYLWLVYVSNAYLSLTAGKMRKNLLYFLWHSELWPEITVLQLHSLTTSIPPPPPPTAMYLVEIPPAVWCTVFEMWSDEFRTEMLTVTVPLLARLRPTSLPQSSLLAIAGMLSPVLGIRNILVRIRIRGFIPLTNGSVPRPDYCYFRQWSSRWQQEIIFFTKFFCLLLFEATFTSFLKDKKS